jgi:hypothetical protein
MPKHFIKIFIVVALILGPIALALPDGAIRDGLGAMQLTLILSAAYAYWKSLKR